MMTEMKTPTERVIEAARVVRREMDTNKNGLVLTVTKERLGAALRDYDEGKCEECDVDDGLDRSYRHCSGCGRTANRKGA